MASPLRALVTGGGGFLGRYVVARLLARGDRVRVYGRRRYPDLAALGVDCRRGNLLNARLLADACRGADVVFHLAALADIWGPASSFRDTNVRGTLNVIAAAAAAGVGRLVYCSTPSVVYDGPIRGGDETLPYPTRHACYYAETKAQAERIVLGANHPDLRTCALRPHLIWGPGDTHLVPQLIARARAGKLRRVGDGRNRISLSYVANVADAHLAACDRLADADSPAAGSAYFVNDDEPVNCWNFINELLGAVGLPPVARSISLGAACRVGTLMETLYRAAGRRRAPPMTRFLAMQLGTDHWFSNAAAKRDLGWTPAVTPDEGKARTIDALRTGETRVFAGLPAAPAPEPWPDRKPADAPPPEDADARTQRMLAERGIVLKDTSAAADPTGRAARNEGRARWLWLVVMTSAACGLLSGLWGCLARYDRSPSPAKPRTDVSAPESPVDGPKTP